MKRARKWINRVSLAVFALSAFVVLANVEQLPQYAEWEGNLGLIIGISKLVFSFGI